MIRGLDGLTSESLQALLAPLLKRLGGRFDRFGGRPAAASAVVLLKSESFVREVIHEFEEDPISVVLTTGQDLVQLRVGASSQAVPSESAGGTGSPWNSKPHCATTLGSRR